MKYIFSFLIAYSLFLISSCSVEKKITRSAKENVLTSAALKTAHVGISIFEPATNKYWFNYQGDHYFVPASNTKLPTCYAAMKYLGDSLVVFRYDELPDHIFIQPAGDPTFLLSEFKNQPGLAFLKSKKKSISIDLAAWKEEPLGSGWSWNDYTETYMAERSAMPVYGNVIQFSGKLLSPVVTPYGAIEKLNRDSTPGDSFIKRVERGRTGNHFNLIGGGQATTSIATTFDTENGKLIARLLSDTLRQQVDVFYSNPPPRSRLPADRAIKSQPLDSMLKLMMHRSDNFFAEQSLLMVSYERLNMMSDEKIIDTLLKTDFKDLPQKPRWVDGSGLSRYNLFSPQDFVTILGKMKNEFGMERVKTIFATGGEGTISSYYKADSGYIYAKTGTLSGVVALSGFLYTKKNKMLIFSVLVNNHNGSATDVRRAIEKFLQGIRKEY